MNHCNNCTKLNVSSPALDSKNIFKCIECKYNTCSLKCLNIHKWSHTTKKDKSSKSLSNQSHLSVKQSLTELYPFLPHGETLIDTTTIDKDYSIDKFSICCGTSNFPQELGSGSFGNVFLGRHWTKPNIYCAIKTISKEKILRHLGSLDLIYNEIKIHSHWIHPNIIRLYNVSEDSRNIKMILEYAKKGTLFNAITSNRAGFTEEAAFKYFIQVIAAISFLHESSIIHRDIKPENIWVTEDNVLKWCDFGWSKEMDFNLRSTYCGTMEYMAPEMISNQKYNNKVDIWSLGVWWYELWNGFSPFRGKTAKIIIQNIKQHNILFFKEISSECKEWIEAMLQNNPSQRITIKGILDHPFIKKYTLMHYKQPKPYNKTIQRKWSCKDIERKKIELSASEKKMKCKEGDGIKKWIKTESKYMKKKIEHTAKYNCQKKWCFDDWPDTYWKDIDEEVDDDKKMKKEILMKNLLSISREDTIWLKEERKVNKITKKFLWIPRPQNAWNIPTDINATWNKGPKGVRSINSNISERSSDKDSTSTNHNSSVSSNGSNYLINDWTSKIKEQEVQIDKTRKQEIINSREERIERRSWSSNNVRNNGSENTESFFNIIIHKWFDF